MKRNIKTENQKKLNKCNTKQQNFDILKKKEGKEIFDEAITFIQIICN